MRKALVVVVAISWAAGAEAGLVGTFGDLIMWAGSGTNQAALLVDFGTSAPQAAPPAVAWGYRWNGEASLDEMIFALAGTIAGSGAPAPAAGSDPRLGVTVTLYPDFYELGVGEYVVDALTYDQVGLPPGWTQEIRTLQSDFFKDLSISSYIAPAAGGVWPIGGSLQAAGFGPVGTALANGGWYGYVVAMYGGPPDYLFPDPLAFSQPTAAIPEPATAILAAAGVAIAVLGLRPRPERATLGGVWPRARRMGILP